MPAPSITGTTSGTLQVATATIDVSMTVPADANVIAVAFGGFANGAANAITSVQGDPDGTPYDLNDLTLYNQRDDLYQYAGIYAIYDDNVNWPGSGSVTVRVTQTRTATNLKACVFCLTDVDIAGTPVNDTDITGEGAAAIPSLTLTSSSNALNVGCATTYSADIGDGDDTLIYEEQNGGSASSLYVWSEAGTGATDTIEGGASVAFAMVAVNFEGTGGGGGASVSPSPLQQLDNQFSAVLAANIKGGVQ